tara:strand:+ start:2550 stop:3395 length:846 start_codon:yes stop_codon:yes gene_type:complete
VRITIIIPAFNEEEFIGLTLQSLLEQSLQANEVIVVDDNSTDATAAIVSRFGESHKNIKLRTKQSSPEHLPGGKVVQAFNYGLQHAQEFDIVCKFDADLIFPENYLELVAQTFSKNEKTGMAGGFCTIEKDGEWVVENLTNKDHIRGALKAYRRECFEQIGGLREAMGWDTVDELLAQYHGWEVQTLPELEVKHLKPTGKTYTKAAKYKQGQAFYSLRYGFLLTAIASAKLASKKGNPSFFMDYLSGYFKARKNHADFLVNKKEGKFIRSLRWQKMREKLF